MKILFILVCVAAGLGFYHAPSLAWYLPIGITAALALLFIILDDGARSHDQMDLIGLVCVAIAGVAWIAFLAFLYHTLPHTAANPFTREPVADGDKRICAFTRSVVPPRRENPFPGAPSACVGANQPAAGAAGCATSKSI